MARAQAEQSYFRFTQGKITEASPLSFPEDSMKDCSNIDINFDGTIQRRRGIEWESGVSVNTAKSYDLGNNTYVQTYEWESVGGYPKATPLLVVRTGQFLHFYELYENVLTNAGVDTLLGTLRLNFDNEAPISFAAAKGSLYVAGDLADPIRIEYTEDNGGGFIQTPIKIQIRDLEGVNDGLIDHERPKTLSGLHMYNLVNQGWSYHGRSRRDNPTHDRINRSNDSPTAFRDSLTRNGMPAQYPSNCDQVQMYTETGDSTGWLMESYITSNDTPTSLAPKGRVIIDAFAENRRTLAQEYSGYTNKPVSPWIPADYQERHTARRPTAIAFYQGHLLYGGVEDKEYNDKIYVSQSLFREKDAGHCYAVNDPTKDLEGSPLDTDGGVITIDGIDKIISMHSIGEFCVVFATNGVWSISSAEGIFTVSSAMINKLTNVGTNSPMSIVQYEGGIYFWAKSGIYSITVDDQFQTLGVVSLTEETIQREYVNIPENQKASATAILDMFSRKIYWFYNDDGDNQMISRYTRALVFDVRSQAFYEYDMGHDNTENCPFVIGGVVKPGLVVETEEMEVWSGNDEVFAGPDKVVVDYQFTTSTRTGSILKLLTYNPYLENKLIFCELSNREFLDWPEYNDGIDYSSFVETGYELLQDAMRNKQATYVFCFFNRTEESYVADETGGVAFDYPSSCFLQAQWNWTGTGSANRWSSKEQVYRFLRPYFPDAPGNPFDYDFLVIETKNKVRGKGKSLSLRFESEPKKDFQLLGWAINYTAEGTP